MLAENKFMAEGGRIGIGQTLEMEKGYSRDGGGDNVDEPVGEPFVLHQGGRDRWLEGAESLWHWQATHSVMRSL